MPWSKFLKKYEKIVAKVRDQIDSGVWNPGDKLPSLRKVSEEVNMSLATVSHAYQILESQGLIVSSSRSGYFIAPPLQGSNLENAQLIVDAAEDVDINDFIFEVLTSNHSPHHVNFSSVYPEPKLYPREQVNKSFIATLRNIPLSSVIDNLPPGNKELRQLIAKRYAIQGMNVTPEEIVITAGALEALNLSLQAVTESGDWVVVESPAFYGVLQTIQKLNLNVISIKADPKEGIDLDLLEEALQSRSIKACWLMTNQQNPLGCTLSDEKKKRLVTLLAQYGTYLIEDDVYSELYFGESKPLPAKAFDQQGMTMHCSSFSKTLVAGFRIGWVAAGNMSLPIQKLQLMSTLSASAPIQLALAKYLTTRNYENHLRQLRRTLKLRKYEMWRMLTSYFPLGVKVHYSEGGGYFLWVELPRHLDATDLYYRALKENISISPGKMFSLGNQYDHCFRLNSSFECLQREHEAIKRLAELIKDMLTN